MMAGVLHQIISGIATGGIYASVALALVMIYQATHHVNFAQGEMATFSTYIALTLINAGLPYWVAFVGAVAISFAIGVAIERILMRRMENAPVLASVGVFVGLLLIINSLSGWLFDYTIKQFPSPFGSGKPMFGGFVSAHELGSTAVTLIVLSAVYLFFRHTRLGLGMRAAAFNSASIRNAVVVLPLVPVMPMVRPRRKGAASSTSPITRIPRWRAASSAGRSAGTPGDMTIRSASAKTASDC